MHNLIKQISILSSLLMFSCNLCAEGSRLWQFNNLTMIAGNTATIEGKPKVVPISDTQVVQFDGTIDRLQIAGNILTGMQNFTLELLVKPFPPSKNGHEPRIVHIEDPNNDKHRLTLEMRFNEQGWYFDAFLRDGDSYYALIDSTLTHPVNRWANIAITYQDGKFTSFVNGHKELEATLIFSPLPAEARTSVGARMNKVNYFHGQIKLLRATSRALSAGEMLSVKTL
ncbi:MAG: LamG domain-containing protein [Paraglaciecola sp.]|uniref:LamG domain-containing protein n=1 Tax=Paraglaciecola sp. TaxID=1920173 RepID=UPI0032996C84